MMWADHHMEQTKSLFEQYIDTIPAQQARINAKGMHKWICPFVQQKQTSLEFMTRGDLIELLNSRPSASPTTMRGRIVILRGFFSWAQEQNRKIVNPAQDISYREIDYAVAMASTYWPNYLSLLNVLNTVWSPDEGLAVYPITGLAWAGVPYRAAGTLPADSIDLAMAKISYQNLCLDLAPEIVDVLRRYSAFTTARRDNRMTMVRTYQSDAFLYRLDIQNRQDSEVSTKPVDAADVLWEASEILTARHLCPPLHYRDVAKSGLLYRMYLMEQAGHPEADVLAYGKPGIKPPAAYPGDLKIIYAAYKKAFNLN